MRKYFLLSGLFCTILYGFGFSQPDISTDLYVGSAKMHIMINETVLGKDNEDKVKDDNDDGALNLLESSVSPSRIDEMMKKVSFYGDISDVERQNKRFENDPVLKEVIQRLVLKEKVKSVEFHVSKREEGLVIQMRVATPIFMEDYSFLDFKLQMDSAHYLYYPEGSSVYGVGTDKGQDFREFRFFSRDGVLITLFSLKKGLFEGQYQTHYDDGKLKNSYSFKEGLENGPYQKYNSDGVMLESGSYVDGKKDGIITFYVPPEDPRSREKIILYVEHYEKGKLVQRDFYKNKAVSKIETY